MFQKLSTDGLYTSGKWVVAIYTITMHRLESLLINQQTPKVIEAINLLQLIVPYQTPITIDLGMLSVGHVLVLQGNMQWLKQMEVREYLVKWKDVNVQNWCLALEDLEDSWDRGILHINILFWEDCYWKQYQLLRHNPFW
ncbi:hypothetical protein J3A83DRAFT_4187733 [Scleroderma citrinum]